MHLVKIRHLVKMTQIVHLPLTLPVVVRKALPLVVAPREVHPAALVLLVVPQVAPLQAVVLPAIPVLPLQ